MEVLFENSYTRDKEWAKDAHSYIYFRQPIMIVLDIIFALYVIIGIDNSIITKSIDWSYVLFPLIWYAFIVLVYIRSVNIAVKRDLEMHGKAIEVTVIVANDIIKQSQSTGSEYQLNYCDIKKAVQTKKYIYLQTKANLLYSFNKDGFSIGNEKDFLMFLKNKGIKVK